jgi:hypothetical protein
MGSGSGRYSSSMSYADSRVCCGSGIRQLTIQVLSEPTILAEPRFFSKRGSRARKSSVQGLLSFPSYPELKRATGRHNIEPQLLWRCAEGTHHMAKLLNRQLLP